MKVTFLAIVLVSVTGSAMVAADPDENCQWKYECCEWHANGEGCKTLCPTATVVCPTEATPARKPGHHRVIVTVPCKEGFKKDHVKLCRKLFDGL
ncbi:uncharacterized protein LOC128274584 [Anopheles cruzii]|uniref:uncharacterized protein LOC128274584 n=1 Tax=Anopheles cruzii TaxID=68878 RepID=UPI0022EC5879|nr:uncharacterized protein LOC128274584 [Anopheles cruzii]